METKLEKKLEINSDEDSLGATYSFTGEGHTLGNALRYILMKNDEVDFCGYNVPHPVEPVMALRLQTKTEQPTEVLKRGLEDLIQLCDNVLGKVPNYRQ